MAIKRPKHEAIVMKLRQVEVLIGKGNEIGKTARRSRYPQREDQLQGLPTFGRQLY